MSDVRRWAAAGLLALVATPALQAQATPPLAFLGFRAGASLAATDAQVHLLLGSGLVCQRSRADPRLQDCRATLTDPFTSQPVSIWLAAIDSMTGIVTVSAILPSAAFARWRTELEAAYGEAPATVRGVQGMVQWIRGTQMLRLTWRAPPGRIEASVSMVDGPVLDGWNLGAENAGRVANPRSPG